MIIKDFCEGEYVFWIYIFIKRMGLFFVKEILKKYFFMLFYILIVYVYILKMYFEMENVFVFYYYL